MYLHLNLPRTILDSIAGLDINHKKQLIGNIILTGGNCRLTGLSLRLTSDLQKLLPQELVGSVHVVDPRLMTGRSDAVIGASYVKRWPNVQWITRKDYILGADDDMNVSSSLTIGAGNHDDQTSLTCTNSRPGSTSSDHGRLETSFVKIMEEWYDCLPIANKMVADSVEFVEIV